MTRADQLWDAVVVGAGPAGSAAAQQLALRGLKVLLVDKARFPREKVCGCCVNRAALASLDAMGMGDVPRRLGATPLRELALHAGGAACVLRLPQSVSVSRRALDMALVERAIEAGACFRPQTQAMPGGPGGPGGIDGRDEVDAQHRYLTLRHGDVTQRVAARIVLAADGLAAQLVNDLPCMKARIAPRSRMGLNAVLASAPAAYEAGRIYMACGRRGYVGLVRLEDAALNIAAAIDPSFVRACGGPGQAAASIIASAQLPALAAINDANWHGTMLLTRRRRTLAAPRLFLLGDAAGYVEPFTGEGIAWALAAARAVAPFAQRASHAWHDALIQQWSRAYRQAVGARQRWCRVVAALLRRPRVTRAMVAMLAHAPALAQPIMRAIHAPLGCEAGGGASSHERNPAVGALP